MKANILLAAIVLMLSNCDTPKSTQTTNADGNQSSTAAKRWNMPELGTANSNGTDTLLVRNSSYIKVEGKHVIIKLNDKTVVDYTEPDNVQREKGNEGRVLRSGTFALQGHDPNSKVFYKNIMVKVLPD